MEKHLPWRGGDRRAVHTAVVRGDILGEEPHGRIAQRKVGTAGVGAGEIILVALIDLSADASGHGVSVLGASVSGPASGADRRCRAVAGVDAFLPEGQGIARAIRDIGEPHPAVGIEHAVVQRVVDDRVVARVAVGHIEEPAATDVVRGGHRPLVGAGADRLLSRGFRGIRRATQVGNDRQEQRLAGRMVVDLDQRLALDVQIVIERLLLREREQEHIPAPTEIAGVNPARRELAKRVVIGVQRRAELL